MSDTKPTTTRPAPLAPEDDGDGGWREILAAWGPAIFVVILVRLFIFEPFLIPSGSMVPTLMIGDHVLVTKFSYGVWLPWKSIGVPFTSIGTGWDNVELVDLGDPERGDIIVFHYPRDEDVTYIKRVVGLPGDTIRVSSNQIVLNDTRVPLEAVSEYADHNAQCAKRNARGWVESLPQADGNILEHAVLTNRGAGGRLSNTGSFTVPEDSVFVMGDNRDHSEDSRSWEFVRYDQIKGKAHFVWFSWDGCSEDSAISVRLDRIFRSLYDEAKVRLDLTTGAPESS